MNRNFQKELEQKIHAQERQGWVPKLLLHSCCAPCSSYVLEYLSQYYEITVLYYNPNIYPEEEYYKRVEEQKAFIQRFTKQQKGRQAVRSDTEPMEGRKNFYPIGFVEGEYDKGRFYEMAKGLEDIPEGGERCFRC